uniref:Uncharacterized protein n=1 Tax=Rhizophora mucronata TaxID=61149 RepID=A0A2P2IHD4_RHIMU
MVGFLCTVFDFTGKWTAA